MNGIEKATVLSGGFGGARFLAGVKHLLPDAEITAIVNTADDIWVHGLRVCPDLDTVMYTLGDGLDPVRGWGRRDETWSIKEDLAAYGSEQTWFGLGDRDIATHLVRTKLLREGVPLSAATEVLCERWQPGIRLLPMTDDLVETHVVVADPSQPDGRRTVHFQEYWVRLHAEVPALEVVCDGLANARPADGVLAAIADADVVFFAPSNPVVSIGPILEVPGVREAIQTTKAPVVGLSPIIGGTHVRGMAEQMLSAIGVEVSAAAVGERYGARSSSGLIDGWLVDTVDGDSVARVEESGLRCAAVPLFMTSHEATAEMARAAIELVR